MDSNSDSGASEPVDLREDQEWEDAEDDTEDVMFVSLFDDRTFRNVGDLLAHTKTQFGCDLRKLQETLGLSDLDQIKLINYIRSEVQKGNNNPDLSKKSIFEDDEYLQPVFGDDAVLYSLEDVFSPSDIKSQSGLHNETETLRQQLASLQTQFQNYREDVQRSISQQLRATDAPTTSLGTKDPTKKPHDDGYFESYSYKDIHHTMLSDKVRTDAYRDFIYENKDIFADKTVLDVGCGTGILSMFCAQAGAKQVIAVDNSDIISKARENIRLNQLDHKILCLRGKVEEVELPVEKVDIIVSEWMGYCLLYESMVDSVIHARDKYLVADGLMVPSHATLRIAPLADSELRIDHIDFWKDVYGFDMMPMLDKAYEEVLIRSLNPKELATGPAATDACTFKKFDLHTLSVDDVSFTDHFDVTWKDGFRTLEGFVIWFDIFFGRDGLPKDDLQDFTLSKSGSIAFTTGPFAQQTHWQQGVLLLEGKEADRKKDEQSDSCSGYKGGDKLRGTVTYSRASKDSRSLQIKIDLENLTPGPPILSQTWKLE